MRWVAVAMAALALAGCGAADKQRPVAAADLRGAVVLETTTWSYEFNYVMRGMYIDGDGGVWAYEQHGTPWYPDHLKAGELSERDMLAKHEGARRIGSVDPALLLDMAQLVPRAAKGPITRASTSGDASGTLEVAYQLDRDRKRYTEIILAGSGARTATNDSHAAAALLDYLREVQRLVGYQ